MNNDNAVIEAAEAVVRDAAGGIEKTVDDLALTFRLAAEQLTLAAHTAQEALSRLYEAAEAYLPLQADAHRQVAALGMSARRWPDESATPLETGIDSDGLLILSGTCCAANTPVEVLLKTLVYVLNENAELPAGTRIGLRIQRHGGGGQ